MTGLDTIIGLLTQYGYLIMFPAAVIGGPYIALIVGFLISTGTFSFVPSVIILLLADIFADMIYYAIGRFGGEVTLTTIFRVTKERILKLEENFKKYSFHTLTIGKFLHGAGVIVLVAAGVVRLSLVEFIGYNALATVVKTILLLIVGYFFGSWIGALRTGLDYIAFGSVLIVLIIGFIVLFARVYPRRN
ncbi:MAG TPA: VTT domain-containing protein [Candidatus Andersenbacteria bacterium]|nr:VTT domain-containing protein [Candidatus Andersenbacteria bacterium]